jgi:anti-sigma factor RsiW
MKCSPFDLKDHFFGELNESERVILEQHLAGCNACRQELHELRLTQSALLAIPEQEPPRRIAFVSDKVFEPNWWQRLWSSGPQLGFVSAAMLSVAILIHGVYPQTSERVQQQVASTPVATVSMTQAQMDAEVNRRIEAAVDKAVLNAVASREGESSQKLMQVMNVRLRQAEAGYESELREIYRRMHQENALVRRVQYDNPPAGGVIE